MHELKEEAFRQVTQRCYSFSEVVDRLGISARRRYKWIRITQPVDVEADELVASNLDM